MGKKKKIFEGRLSLLSLYFAFMIPIGLSIPARSQNETTLGLYGGAGAQFFGIVPMITPYTFEDVMLHLSYGRTFRQWRKLKLDLMMEVKVGKARYAEPTGPPWSQAEEIGGAVGLRQQFIPMQGKLTYYLMYITGPHYLSAAPTRQVPGYLFGNYTLCGVMIRLNEQVSIEFRWGWQHMSNAGLKEPNGGINTLMFQLGLITTAK